MAFSSAFQPNAFQNNAFQIDQTPPTGQGSVGVGRFTKGHWRRLKEEEIARIEAARRAKQKEADRASELKQAADAKARAAILARRAQEDADAAAARQFRILQDSLAAFSGAKGLAPQMPEPALMAAHKAMAERDDEEAIALLLLMHDR